MCRPCISELETANGSDPAAKSCQLWNGSHRFFMQRLAPYGLLIGLAYVSWPHQT